MPSEPLSTEGRVFVAQMMRDVRARSRLGAGLLSPGAASWREALDALGHRMSRCRGPVRAGSMFAASRALMIDAQEKHEACMLNAFGNRKRSGFFQLLTFEISKHPLTNSGYDGIMVCSYSVHLRRVGEISLWGSRVAYISWHALGRLYERSNIDLYGAQGIVGMIGLVGVLMRESPQHLNTGINVAFENDVMCAGILRPIGERSAFFDCLTVLPGDEPQYEQQRIQAGYVAMGVKAYMDATSSDPTGYADKIPVLPFSRSDYVTRELQRKSS